MSNKNLDFILDSRIEPERQHVLWYHECLLPLAFAEFEGSMLIVCNKGEVLLELYSYDEGKIYDSRKRPSCGIALKRYISNDEELMEVINGTHKKYYIKYEKINHWESFYLLNDKQISVGRLDSPFLNEGLNELKESSDHIVDIAKICAED